MHTISPTSTTQNHATPKSSMSTAKTTGGREFVESPYTTNHHNDDDDDDEYYHSTQHYY